MRRDPQATSFRERRALALRPLQKIRLAIALLALILPAVALIAIVAGVVLFRYDRLGLHEGQLWLAASAAAGGLALAVLLIGRLARWVSWRWMLLLAIPALAPIVAGGLALRYLDQHPSTAEVSTDLVDPPAFAGTAAAPFPEDLAEEARGRPGELRSLVLRQPPQPAYAIVQAAVEARPGWRVTDSQPPETLQGTAVFGRFRYQRDWTIRVRPELGGGALVDLRLRSRPGEPDLGENSKMVRTILSQVRQAADQDSIPR